MILKKSKQQNLNQPTMQRYIQQFSNGDTKDIPMWILEEFNKLKVIVRETKEQKEQVNHLDLLTSAFMSGIWEAKIFDHDFFSSQTQFLWQSTAQKLLGYSNSSALSDSISAFNALLHADQRQDIKNEINQFIQSARSGEHTIQHKLKNAAGHYREVTTVLIKQQDPVNKCVHLYGIMTDIHDRSIAEQADQVAIKKHSLITQAMTEGAYYITFKRDGKTLPALEYWFSSQYNQILGENRPEYYGTIEDFLSSVYPQDLDEGLAIFDAFFILDVEPYYLIY